MKVELLREKQKIDNIFSLIKDQSYDAEILTHWARYICILTSGLLENSLRIMLLHYSTVHSHPNVSNYAKKNIRSITNLNAEKLRQLLGSFSSEWSLSFEQNLSSEQKDAMDSIVANRNNIAHGYTVGITLARVRAYYSRILEIVSWIDDNCISK